MVDAVCGCCFPVSTRDADNRHGTAGETKDEGKTPRQNFMCEIFDESEHAIGHTIPDSSYFVKVQSVTECVLYQWYPPSDNSP